MDDRVLKSREFDRGRAGVTGFVGQIDGVIMGSEQKRNTFELELAMAIRHCFDIADGDGRAGFSLAGQRDESVLRSAIAPIARVALGIKADECQRREPR